MWPDPVWNVSCSPGNPDGKQDPSKHIIHQQMNAESWAHAHSPCYFATGVKLAPGADTLTLYAPVALAWTPQAFSLCNVLLSESN